MPGIKARRLGKRRKQDYPSSVNVCGRFSLGGHSRAHVGRPVESDLPYKSADEVLYLDRLRERCEPDKNKVLLPSKTSRQECHPWRLLIRNNAALRRVLMFLPRRAYRTACVLVRDRAKLRR